MELNQAFDPMGQQQLRIGDYIYERVSDSLVSREHRSHVSLYSGSDIKNMEEYRYNRLQSMRRRIRLLRLHGGGLANPEITCELFEVQFYQADNGNVVRLQESDKTVIEYEALSWCWGREERDRAIRIQGQDGEYYRLRVSKELSLALKYLRYPHKNRILWIDAICIDQQNHEERNHQVQMMARIYNGASQACIWLGQDNDESTKAIAFIHEIMKLENFDTVSEKSENASKWQSLLLLMQRPWFSRRWVVQEVALARAATIYCGTDYIPWEHFAVAVELFVEVETATHRLSEVMRKNEQFGHIPQWFEHVSELGASILVQATGKVFRRDGTDRVAVQHGNSSQRTFPLKHSRSKTKKLNEAQDSNPSSALKDWSLQRPLLSLEYLVSSLTVFEAVQPRDAVYSLLAISRDTAPFAEVLTVSQDGSEEAMIMSTLSSFLERKPFKVDYSRPYSDICKDFISFCIQVSGKSDPSKALDILCRPWAPEPEPSHSIVTHKKPTPYKYLKSREDLCRRPLDPGATAKYIDGIKERYKDPAMAHLRSSFDRDVAPFLPREPRKPTGAFNSTANGNVQEDADEDRQDDDADSVDDMELPSWVSRISGASFALFRLPGMNEGTRIGRQNADSLVGAPEDGYKTYSTAQNTKVDYKTLSFRKRPPIPEKGKIPARKGHHSLFTEGFVLGEVQKVMEPARLGAIPTTWAELADWEGAMDGSTVPPAEFWRTLVADRGKDHRNPPYYFATACKESFKKGGFRGGSVDTGALISKERNSIIAEFCRRVQTVIWNRCLIRTTINVAANGGQDPKPLGLASEKVKKGDLVCVLFGCTVPVILRRFEKTEAELRAEKMQDSIESLKAAVSKCEDACFRKIRYQKRLEEERKKGDYMEEHWRKEVQEELKVVNEKIQEWNAEELNQKEKKVEDKEKQKKRGIEAEKRRKARNLTLDRMQKQGRNLLQPTKNRSFTMPATPEVTLSATSFIVADKTRETSPNQLQQLDQADDEARSSGNRGRARKRDLAGAEVSPESPGDKTQEAEDEANEKARELAKAQDPYRWYKFVGEAYIHGLMDGEAIRLQINEGTTMPKRMFEIR